MNISQLLLIINRHTIGPLKWKIKDYLRKKLVDRLQSIPVLRMEIMNMDNVLIISPHPDDEVFGCGMLIKTLCEVGKHVEIIILSKGEAALPTSVISKDNLIKARMHLTEKALSNLGLNVSNLYYSDFKDGAFYQTPQHVIDKLKEQIKIISPDNIFYNHPQDASPDHLFAAKILKDILYDVPSKKYHYCVWLWHKLPMKHLMQIDFSHALFYNGDIVAKHKSMDVYTEARTEGGYKYSGDLSALFLKFADQNAKYILK